MKRVFFLLVFLAVAAVWCPASFAARQQVPGAGTTPLNADGVTDGVDMTGSATTGTLSVGVVGGPATNIFTNNNPLGTVAGLAVSTDASSTSNILFNSSSTVFGNIGITQPGGPFFLNIRGGADSTTVNFLGSVFATTTFVTGTGTLNFNSGSTNITATIFNADGTISLAPNTTVIGALTTTAGANTGTLLLGGGSSLDGAVGAAAAQLKQITVTGGSNLAGVTGTITGAVFARTFSLGTNTLNIGGALTIGAGGLVNTTLASPAIFGSIRPVGATNLPAALTVNVTVPDTAVLLVGNQFNIIQTRTGTAQSGTDGSVLTVTVQNPTNPLYTFSAVPLAGTLAGLVTIRVDSIPVLVPLAPPPGVILPPVAPIAVVVVPPLLAVVPDILAPLNAIADPIAVVNALAQLAPAAPSVAAPLVTFQGARQFHYLWLSRMEDDLCCKACQSDNKVSQPGKEQTPACPPKDDARGSWWLKGFGLDGEQDSKGSFVGYDVRTYGVMIAYDKPLGTDARAGFGLGYARSEIDGNTFSADTDIDSYRATVYLGYEPGTWYLRGSASFGWNEYEGRRDILFPGVNRRATADYSGQDYTGYVTAGYHFFTHGLTITPLASLQYTHLRIDGFTETGAGDVNLKVDSENDDFLESGLGVKVARPFGYGGGKVVPEVHFKWFHELSNPTLEKTARLAAAGSPSFTTPGFETADNTYNVGGGVTFLSCECAARKWSFEAVYDYEWRNDNYSSHQAMLKFVARF